MLVGGNWNNGYACGPFYVNLNNLLGYANVNISGLAFFLNLFPIANKGMSISAACDNSELRLC